jgi:hypothetical protein
MHNATNLESKLGFLYISELLLPRRKTISFSISKACNKNTKKIKFWISEKIISYL